MDMNFTNLVICAVCHRVGLGADDWIMTHFPNKKAKSEGGYHAYSTILESDDWQRYIPRLSKL